MLPINPTTARSIHQGDLIAAAEYRQRHQIRRYRTLRTRFVQALEHGRFAVRAPTRLDGRLPVFAGLSRRRLRQLEGHFEIVEFGAGQTVGEQGEIVADFGVLLSGTIGVSIDGEVIAVLEPGSPFGSTSLIYPVGYLARQASLVALDDATVASSSATEIRDVLGQFPSVYAYVRRLASDRRAYFQARANRQPVEALPRYPVLVG